MRDEPLIAALMAASDTLSRGAAEQAIRIVREHDRRVDIEHDPDWPRLIENEHPEGCRCFRCWTATMGGNIR